ncbi:MAG: 50S ribosomal protein L29 [bacterium]|jgi:large subunit ribosomal protein L29|nr:50S ribosomal protein L29 [bacterium]MDD3805366.1 50S ribosomal protein L29 [bacterium]MDD4558366.1 50S ribosomal protein L29 [bacterium]
MKRSQFKNQLKDMNLQELALKLAEAKEELFNLRFKRATGNLENPSRMGTVKKEIARIMTAMAGK